MDRYRFSSSPPPPPVVLNDSDNGDLYNYHEHDALHKLHLIWAAGTKTNNLTNKNKQTNKKERQRLRGIVIRDSSLSLAFKLFVSIANTDIDFFNQSLA